MRILGSLSETEEFDERLCSALQHCRLHHVKAFSWQAYGPTLSKPLISLDWKNSEILTEYEATTTT